MICPGCGDQLITEPAVRSHAPFCVNRQRTQLVRRLERAIAAVSALAWDANSYDESLGAMRIEGAAHDAGVLLCTALAQAKALPVRDLCDELCASRSPRAHHRRNRVPPLY
jgi:hypothetical protein